jgi:Rod binding domain-containing protein
MSAAILQSAAPPDLADPRCARAWKTAQDFEAMTLGELLKPMFDTVDTASGPFGGGAAESAWKPMLVQEMAKQTARAGGLGIAAHVYSQILRMQDEAKDLRR